MDRLGRLRLMRSMCTATHPPGLRRLLVANRGEIALRILRAADDLELRTVAIFAPDDALSLHTRAAGTAVAVPSYFDAQAIVSAAVAHGCDAIHPGYGFLSESASFAEQCERAGLTFVGPTGAAIAQLGDKLAARRLARRLGVPVAPGSSRPCASAAEVREMMVAEGVVWPLMLKAAGGGGGRGMRPVRHDSELDAAFGACVREAAATGGTGGGVFFEQLIPNARHLEVQLLGDGTGQVSHLYERDCSVQRRRQKVLEVAPALGLSSSVREEMLAHSLKLAEACNYRSAGTCEFLLGTEPGARPVFLECNPRIQVEHTVSEEATGVDLVRAQLLLAGGHTLASLNLTQPSIQLRAQAIQARVQMVSAGRVSAYAEPGGIGIRVESALYAGCEPPTAYDPLLLKIIASAPLAADAIAALAPSPTTPPPSPSPPSTPPLPTDATAGAAAAFDLARRRLLRACGELHIGGSVRTNAAELHALLSSAAFRTATWTTAQLDESPPPPPPACTAAPRAALLDDAYPRAGDAAAAAAAAEEEEEAPEGCVWVGAPVRGVVCGGSLAEVGARVRAGGVVGVVEALKMEWDVVAPCGGEVEAVRAEGGARVDAGEPLLLLRVRAEAEGEAACESEEEDKAAVRADLAAVLERRRGTTDEARAEREPSRFGARRATRHAKGQRTARENLAALVDAGSFLEYGRFALAAQRQRLGLDELLSRSPADGLVCGVATVSGAPACVLAYDATVLAGTQGFYGHMKLDRMFEQAHARRLPVVLFAEGGGGRPGETDVEAVHHSWLTCESFGKLASLSALVPLVGVASGFCFAGNAALLGTCDVVIATRGANIGMAGPAMIAGGGLGTVAPHAIGPAAEQARQGVVDLLVDSDAEAVEAAKRYLSFFHPPLAPPAGGFDAAEQTALRGLVPTNRRRAYEMRELVETVSDRGAWLELRGGFAKGMITGLGRVEGKALGVIANDPRHLGGAIDADGALKASRFMELCDAFDLPLLFLCDTPGFMVGPEHERQAAVRKLCRMFTVAASLAVPFCTIVTRKSYGLGAQAMAGGAAVSRNAFHVSWPTAEAGPMNIEGAVELGYSKELATAAEESPLARQQLFEKLVAAGYEGGSALNVARTLETDDVIDPAESRMWIAAMLRSHEPVHFRDRHAKRRPCVSPW